MKEPFNANFYITAATLLPVLYIAIVLQGSTYAILIKRAIDEWLKNLAIYWIVRIAAYVILSSWVIGEVLSVYALYEQSDSAGVRKLVLAAVVILILTASAGPAKAYFTHLHKAFSAPVRSGKAASGAAKTAPPRRATPDAGSPETASGDDPGQVDH